MAVFIKNQAMGVYYMDFELMGKRYQKSCRTKERTEAEAREAEEKKRVKIELGMLEPGPVTRGPLTLSQAIRKGEADRWSKKRDGALTVKRLFICADLIGDVPLREITTPVINSLKNKLYEGGRQPATVNRFMAHMKTLLRIAGTNWGEPVQKVVFEKEEEPEGRTRELSKEEEAKALALLRSDKRQSWAVYSRGLADLMEVLLGTGMRLSEGLNITYGRHINLKTGHVLLTPDITKSKKTRKVKLTVRALQILKERRGEFPDQPFPFRKDTMVHRWAKLRRDMGLEDDPEFVIHALRHTYASRLVQKDVSIYTVQKLLGHARVTTTERYAKLHTKNLDEAVQVLNED